MAYICKLQFSRFKLKNMYVNIREEFSALWTTFLFLSPIHMHTHPHISQNKQVLTDIIWEERRSSKAKHVFKDTLVKITLIGLYC